MRLLPFSLISFLSGTSFVHAQIGPKDWTASPFNAPALPLAVKSPYLNTWLPQGNKPNSLSELWPTLWTMDAITGWYSSVVVDGLAYRIMGAPLIANITNASQISVEFTATRTSFIFNAGPMQINASFISPVEPTDLVRQSLPFSYHIMSASSLDGNPHQLRMYSDITGQFITADSSRNATWSADDEDQHVVLSMQLETGQMYTEAFGRAQDAVEYYAFRKISGATISWAITEASANRNRAANMTNLGNQQDTTPRENEGQWPTLGIAIDWKSVTSTPEPAVWAIGLVRSPTIQYQTPSGTIQEHFPFFLTQWSDGVTAAKAFLDDYKRTTDASGAFDTKLSAAGSAIFSEYADLLALSARQVMGSLDITLSKTAGGTWNFSDTKVFMKNMGSAGSDHNSTGGTGTSVNTVDSLYAAMPAFLYLNPEIVGYLLSPLLEYQDSSVYTLSYAARNIGSSYPNATADGILSTHDYSIEETANMLIMMLAYSQRTGNRTLFSKHYGLLRGWAEYLEDNTMSLLNEKSADFTETSQVSINNQTNLVLKGIIGIACMSKIAELAVVAEDQQHFNDSARTFIRQWQASALASDGSDIDFIAGTTGTNGLIYNSYADQLLQLYLVPDRVYHVAVVSYNTTASEERYGIPLDNEDPGRTGAHWMMFSASTVQDSATRQYMMNQVHEYVASNQNNTPFSAYYSPSNGIADGSPNAGKNSPAIGGVFALLALNTTIQSDINTPGEGSTPPNNSALPSRSKAGPIAGAVVGGLAGVAIIGAGILFCLRRRRRLREQNIYNARVDPLTSDALANPTLHESKAKVKDVSGNEALRSGTAAAEAETTPGSRQPLDRAEVVPSNIAGEGGVQIRHDGAQVATHHSERYHRERSGVPGPSAPPAENVGASSGRGTLQQDLSPERALVDELRSQVDNLRRDLLRIREERRLSVVCDESLPEYDGPP